MRVERLAGLWLMTGLASTTAAQAGELSVSLGVGVAPSSVGDNAYQAAPLPAVEYRNKSFGLRSNNLGLETTLALGGGLTVGGIARLDPGRDDLFDVKDRVLDRLQTVDKTFEAGLLLEYARPVGPGGDWLVVGRGAAITGVSGGHKGVLLELSAAAMRTVTPDLTLGFATSLTWQDRAYANTFFGVDAADSRRSGLAIYQAGRGVRDVGVSAFATRQLTRSWSTTATLAYSRLQDAAAASPIVRVRGSRDQLFGGVLFTRAFGQALK